MSLDFCIKEYISRQDQWRLIKRFEIFLMLLIPVSVFTIDQWLISSSASFCIYLPIPNLLPILFILVDILDLLRFKIALSILNSFRYSMLCPCHCMRIRINSSLLITGAKRQVLISMISLFEVAGLGVQVHEYLGLHGIGLRTSHRGVTFSPHGHLEIELR